MESEKTLEQKKTVEDLTQNLNKLENYRTYLSKYVMDERNAQAELFVRASAILMQLKSYLKIKRDELQEADAVWMGFQLDDLEAEICQPQVSAVQKIVDSFEKDMACL